MDNINIDNTSPEYAQISIDSPLQPVAIQKLSSDALEDRSAIASLGLSNTTGISQQQFKDSIVNGEENVIRQQAASKLDQTKIGWAKQMVDQFGTRLPDDTLQTMLKAQNPNSVFEEHYAKSYMDFVNWPKQDDKRDNWAWTVANTHPEA